MSLCIIYILNIGDCEMKQLVEFREEEEGEAVLEVSAFALSPKELSNVLEELSEEKVHYTFIDADSVSGIVRDRYEKVRDVMDSLFVKGWLWNGEKEEEKTD